MNYSEFKANIFKCLKGEDDDCVGYDTIIDSLKNYQSRQMSKWFEMVMNDWNEFQKEEN